MAETKLLGTHVDPSDVAEFTAFAARNGRNKKVLLLAAAKLLPMMPERVIGLLVVPEYDLVREVIRQLPPVPSDEELQEAVVARRAKLAADLASGLRGDVQPTPELQPEASPQKEAGEAG